jgi:predicted amidohydrolase
MNVVCVQLDIAWENKPANHAKVSSLIEAAAPPSDSLVVLPEMFATGFSMNVAAISDSSRRETQDFMARTAADYGIYLMGGIVTTAPDGKGLNECVTYAPDGVELARYCKMHPFTIGGESAHYSGGDRPLIFTWQGFQVAPFICYDLRFPEIFRRAVFQGATLYTVIASWPTPRHDHWVTLLKARAIENQAYVIGVNRCGEDPQHRYRGQSMVVDPHGRVIVEAGSEECAISADLDLPGLIKYRQELPFLDDIRDQNNNPAWLNERTKL